VVENYFRFVVASWFSKENVDVFHVNSKDLKRILNNPKLSIIIYDGDLNNYNNNLGNFLINNEIQLRMKQLLSTNDNISSSDFYHQLLQFVNVRSFAVNTMRHGAPLELEF